MNFEMNTFTKARKSHMQIVEKGMIDEKRL